VKLTPFLGGGGGGPERTGGSNLSLVMSSSKFSFLGRKGRIESFN
jgi:hypothetical protein